MLTLFLDPQFFPEQYQTLSILSKEDLLFIDILFLKFITFTHDFEAIVLFFNFLTKAEYFYFEVL